MKNHRIPRIARKTARFCLVLSILDAILLSSPASAEPPRSQRDTEPQKLDLEDGRPPILAFAPIPNSRKPIAVVYLHGIQGNPDHGCPWMRQGASRIGWLLCPAANGRVALGTYSWTGGIDEKYAQIVRAERAARAQGVEPEAASVLVGFSQGAYLAVDLMTARRGRYRGLVLIGASVAPSRALLSEAGVERVVFAAGDFDAASTPMKRAAESLERQGAEVRFLSLGRIGHSYQTSEVEKLSEAIAWAGSKPEY